MKKSKLYFQCDLHQGTGRMTSWIEQRGALLGATVEMEGLGLWKVTHVYDGPMTEAQIHEKYNLDRDSLPSIRKHK